jgi:hypothetical protein
VRAVFLILVVLWGWLGAMPSVEVPAGPRDERVQAVGHDEAVLVARIRPGDLVRSLEARRPHPLPFGLGHAYNSSTSLHIECGQAAARTLAADKPADAAHRLFVLARPLEPRAPPPARS